MEKLGIELGIRAKISTIKKAAIISENSEKVHSFFIPETQPKFIGVDAFETLQSLSRIVNKVRLGTGVVNVFARSENDLLNQADKIFHQTSGNFVLGLGTSTPYIIEKMYKMKFFCLRLNF